MIFTTKLSLNASWEEASRKGKKGVIEILKTMRILDSCDPMLFWKMFDAQVEPIMTYAAEVWGLEDNILMERVQTFAIKRFLRVPIHASNSVMYGDTGRYSLYIQTYVKCIRYWLRLLKLPRQRLCKQAYDMLINQMEMGYSSWATKVKDILMVNGFGFVWLNQGVGDEKMFLLEFKDRLISCFKQNWHSKLECNEKYSWFLSFKDSFQLETYLQTAMNKWHRSIFARFRSRTLGLRANKLWFKKDNDNRNCLFCTEQMYVEDETHFVFHCKAYDHIRKYYSIFYTTAATYSDVSRLLCSQDTRCILSLAKFIAEAYKLRQRKLEELGM